MKDETPGVLQYQSQTRIQQLTKLHRAINRSRSYAIVATLVCAVAIVQAGVMLVRHLAGVGWGWRVLVYCGFMIAGAWGMRFFARRAMALHRESTQTHLDTPTAPPDFSTLSDGSQRWKNLEEIR